MKKKKNGGGSPLAGKKEEHFGRNALGLKKE